MGDTLCSLIRRGQRVSPTLFAPLLWGLMCIPHIMFQDIQTHSISNFYSSFQYVHVYCLFGVTPLWFSALHIIVQQKLGTVTWQQGYTCCGLGGFLLFFFPQVLGSLDCRQSSFHSYTTAFSLCLVYIPYFRDQTPRLLFISARKFVRLLFEGGVY